MKTIYFEFPEYKFEVQLRDTETAKAILKILPIEAAVKKWGDEFYFEAPLKQKVLWSLGNVFGINIIRIRKNKIRYGTKAGNTFKGRHLGFYSFFTELKRPVHPLWNSSMTILEDNNLYS